MNSKTAAEKTRKGLKALGITPKQVSVRQSGGSIEIRIKDLSIPASVVKNIAEEHERVDFCERSMEILSGGNLFVFVSYDHDALMAISGEVAKVAEAVRSSEDWEAGRGVPIVEGFTAFKNGHLVLGTHPGRASLHRYPDLRTYAEEAILWGLQAPARERFPTENKTN